MKLQAPADYAFALNLCDSLFLYEAAIEGLGTSYVSALNIGGTARFGRSLHDAPVTARYLAWDNGCSCFTYRSTVVPIPTL